MVSGNTLEEIEKENRWELEVEKICTENNIFLAQKPYETIKGLGIDEYFKLMILPLKKMVEIEDEQISMKIGSVYITAEKKREKGEKNSLEELHDVYKKLLYIEDSKRIDVGLAVALARKEKGIPLWLFFVGPSGDMKTFQLDALDDKKNSFILLKMTAKTLVNGFKDKEKCPDIAPMLNNKLIIIRDMAPLLKLNPVEKGEVWGQLRELYDGNAGGAFGTGVVANYTGIYTTMLAGSTPAIDGQILIHQDLGTRELIYRTTGSKNEEKVMRKCMDNENYLERIKKKINTITTNFINNREIVDIHVAENVKQELMKIATYITYMRATAEIDQYTQEVRTDVVKEEPTRIIMQLKRLYICLKSLKENYPDQRAFEILWKIAKSSAFQTRKKVLSFLVDNQKEYTTSQVAKNLLMGKSTIKRDLSILWNMGLVKRRDTETSFPDKFIYHWEINNDNDFIDKYSRYEKKRHKIEDYIIEEDGEK